MREGGAQHCYMIYIIEIVINYLRLPYPKTTQGPGSVIGPICQSEKRTNISDQLGN